MRRSERRVAPFAEHFISRARWRLALSYALVMAGLLLAVILAIYLALWREETSVVRSQLIAMANQKRTQPDITDILRQRPALKDEEEPIRTFVISPDGVLRKADAVRKQAPDPEAVRRVLAGHGPIFSRGLLPTNTIAVYTAPIIRHGKRLGAVQSVTSFQPYGSFLRDLLLISVVVAIPALLAAALAALFMSSRALGPLREATRSQQAFAQNAAHELRAPLTVLRTSADLALASQEQNEMREALEIGVRQTDQLSALVTDVEALARADAGYLARESEEVDLAALLRSVGQEADPMAGAKDVQLVIQAASPAIVTGDELRLRQFFLILLDNAVKFSPPGGQIDVVLAVQHRRAIVTVRDSGPGIAASHLPHVFERFYRADRARTPGVGGTGLGLAIAREIAQAHGGTVTVESIEGHGATFHLTLPLAPAP